MQDQDNNRGRLTDQAPDGSADPACAKKPWRAPRVIESQMQSAEKSIYAFEQGFITTFSVNAHGPS